MVLTRAALLDRIPVAAPGPLVGLCVSAMAGFEPALLRGVPLAVRRASIPTPIAVCLAAALHRWHRIDGLSPFG